LSKETNWCADRTKQVAPNWLEGESQARYQLEFVKVVFFDKGNTSLERNQRSTGQTFPNQEIQREKPLSSIHKVHRDILRWEESYKPFLRQIDINRRAPPDSADMAAFAVAPDVAVVSRNKLYKRAFRNFRQRIPDTANWPELNSAWPARG
jgi:hypothetical protein